MFTSALLALLLTVTAQKNADRLAPPERPVFGFPTEGSIPDANSAQPASSPSPAANNILPASFFNDARLADVCFVDDQFGWAVGDRGVIWHTEDGGRQWQLQHSGANCSLQSVFFMNRKIGWAAGGSAQPYSHTGTGVLLATRDGGQTWTGNARLLLPALKRILFTDPEHGWAIGFPSAMYPSGVFTSDDMGRNWRPLAPSGGSTWLTGDFLSPNAGALAGCYATAATVKHGDIEPIGINNSGLQNIRQLRLVPPVYGWLVGDGGLVMITGNAGTAWKIPSGDLPSQAVRQFDFAALAARGPKAWIAGTPGSRIFYTPDAGSSWSSFSTGLSTPITAMNFVDDQHGWAVGALGTILATSDGGRTWQRQRAGGTRAAILCLVAQAEDVPLELLAKLSGNDGYLSAVEVLGRRDIEVRPNDEVPLAERLDQALVAVGGSYADLAWQFPLRQTGLQITEEQYRKTTFKVVPQEDDSKTTFKVVLQDSNAIHYDLDIPALEEHLIRQLRLWRPEVVITNNPNSRDTDQLGQLIGKAVLQAVDKAANPTCYPEQIDAAGLSPWQVKKVYAAGESGAHGSIEITTSQFAARLGRSLADAAAEPRGLLSDSFCFSPITLGVSSLINRVPENQQSRDLMSSLALAPGGEARRDLTNAAAENIEMLQHAALKLRNTQAILEQSEHNPAAETTLFAQSGELTGGLDDNNAGRILYHLADRYYRTGRWSMAAETFTLLADRYPRHPLARPALLWLVQYYASGEAAWRQQAIQKVGAQQTTNIAIDAEKLEDRLDRTATLGKQIERTRPELFAEPALRFPLAAAWRNQGLAKPAEQFYLAESRNADRNAWAACAQGEISLTDPKAKQSKPTQRCWKAAAKPKLDGRLDDAIWQKVESSPLKSALNDDEQWPAVVAFAYDAEFLYIGISCRRAPGAKYEPAATSRLRDTDVTGQDHVDVLIDIDRDFSTYYQLSVDYRGFTADSLWGDSTWNPTWFVAADMTDEAWTVEAAIPLDQLAPRCPNSRAAWAVGVQRTIPGVGFQSWSTPASTNVTPQGFGYLIFE
jgi:photosystem II stability/assembly factor-like uncharacterized protein